jgi:hypothetical protein
MTPARRASISATALSLALACASLAYTASFDLDPFDSAELALVAVTAGLGHPPSQPAHTMLGWLVTRGPVAPLTALAWLSIAPAALAFWLAIRSSIVTRTAPDPLRTRALFAALSLACVGLAPVRAVSTRVEVYALAACFTVGALALARSGSARSLAASSALWGLAGATNPVLAAQGAWAILAPLLRARRWLAALSVSVGAVSTTLATYAYAFAARAREEQTLVWDAPRDARSLWRLLSARDFAANVSLTATTWLSNALWFLWDLTRAGVTPLLALGLWGLARKDEHGRHPWLGGLLFSWVVGVAMVAANAPYRGENPDYGGYVLISCALASAGCARLLRALDGERPRAANLVALSLLATGALLALRDGRSSHGTRAIATRALEAAPQRAIAVLSSDHLLFSALYLQGVEGLRRDVVVLNPGWASSRWAWRWAQARDPSLLVDLSPGRSRERRLALSLERRADGRAVVAEDTALLALAGGGESCPRALLWSSREGCDPSTRSTVETVRWIRDGAARARAERSRWDQRLYWSTALVFGQSARSLGCAGIAARAFAAALGQETPLVRACGGRPMPARPVDLLTVSEDTVREELDRTRPLAAAMQ